MQEQIFDPIQPVTPFDNLGAVGSEINGQTNPLSPYGFNRSKAVEECTLGELSFGSGWIDDVNVPSEY
jgi:acyl-CoA reductase-like NAD-dependent aldehyde dehydrogenase